MKIILPIFILIIQACSLENDPGMEGINVLSEIKEMNNNPQIIQEGKSFNSILNSVDSIECWGSQFTEYYDTSSMELLMSMTVWCGLYYFSADSITSFAYQCNNFKTEPYTIVDGNLNIKGSQTYRIKIDADTLRLQGKSIGDIYYDSLEVVTLNTYVKVKISTSDLINLYEIRNDTSICDSIKLLECLDWPHYENVIFGFNKKYSLF